MSKQHQVVIKFTGNTTQAEAAMRKLKTEMAAVGAEVSKVDTTVKKVGGAFTNVSQVTLKSTASLQDLRRAIKEAGKGVVEVGATLDNFKIKTRELHTKTISAAEAAKKAAIEQARYNRVMNQGAIDAQRLAAATARAATAAQATTNQNALASIRQTNALTAGTGTTARANATIANAGISQQAAALRLQEQQAAAAAASTRRLEAAQDRQAASAARATLRATNLQTAESRQAAAATRAELAALRLANANSAASRSSETAGAAHGLSAKHVLMYSAAYMAAATAITGFLATLASVPQLGMKLQATESGLLGVYKNQALVNEQLGFLSRLADEAGVKVTTLRDAYVQFTASAIKAGITVDDAQKQFTNYAKTARALNLNDQDFQGMLTAIQQILSKGKIMSEELQGQLGEHIPAAVAIMAKSIENADGTIGVTTMQLRKMMEQGQLTSLEMQRFSDILFTEFSQGYAASVDNLSAETARFGNAWDEVATTIFKATESIMADVVKLSTGALHQLNETLQTTTDHITDIDGRKIRFSVEPKTLTDLNAIERALVNIEGLLDKSAAGWASAFSKWGASFDRLKASMDFGLHEAVFGDTSGQFRDTEQVTQNLIQANAALGAGFEKLARLSELGSDGISKLKTGHEKYAIVLRDELAVALRNYNQQAAEMVRQIAEQEKVVANLNRSGQSSRGETARLAESKQSYQDLMGVISNYADLFVKTNQKIGTASNEAKAALDAEAKTAAEGVKTAQEEEAAKKAAIEAKKQHTAATVEAGKVLSKEGELLQSAVERQAAQIIGLNQSAAATKYFEERLRGLTHAQAMLVVETDNAIAKLDEQNRIQREGADATAGLRTKYLNSLKEKGITDDVQKEVQAVKSRTDEVVQAQIDFKNAVDETTERLKAQADAAKAVTTAVEASTGAESGINLSGVSQELVKVAGDFDALINKAAKATGVSAAFIKAIAQQETGFLKTPEKRAAAVSPVGAGGVMQIMPNTGRDLGLSASERFDPEKNIMAGAKYLKQMLEKFNGSEILASAAYNAGPGAVNKYNGVPPYKETQTYVQRVAAYTDLYRKNTKEAQQVVTNTLPYWETLTTKTKAATPEVTKLADATVNYSGKLQEVTTELTTQQLADQYMAEQTRMRVNSAERELSLIRDTGEELAKRKLLLDEFSAAEANQIQTAEQRLEYEKELVSLERELAAVKAPGLAAKYQAELSTKDLSKADIERLTGKKLEIEFATKMSDLDRRAEQATMTAEAYKYLTLVRDGFSESLIQGQMAWEKEVIKLEEVAIKQEEVAKEVAEVNKSFASAFESDLTDALKTGELNFQSFADTVIDEITRLQVIKPLMDSLFGSDGKGGLMNGGSGGLFGTISSWLGFKDGGAFIEGSQTFANGGAFHNTVLHKPTQFFANGGLAVAGEAGAEAVMPLTRIGGKLGVMAVGGGNVPVVVQPKISINVTNSTNAAVTAKQSTDSQGNISIDLLIAQVEGTITDRARRGTGLANVFKRV